MKKRFQVGHYHRWLQPIFMLALAWPLFWLNILLLDGQFYRLNPFPEDYRVHGAYEAYFPCLAAIAAAGAVTLLLRRFWPGFLSLPGRVAPWRLLISFPVAITVVALILAIVIGGGSLLLDPPLAQPDNPQYIAAVFWAVPMGTIGFTPVATVFGVWWWWLRRLKHGSKGQETKSGVKNGQSDSIKSD